MKFIFGAELTSAVRATVSGRQSDIGVAFWGHQACDRIALPSDCDGIRVLCDAFSGACNPSAIEDLLSRGAEVRSLSGFHAKVYIGEHQMVSCSANASANGLGEEDGQVNANLEAGFVSKDAECLNAAKHWFDDVFKSAKTVDDADIRAINELWARRRKDRPVRTPTLSLFDMLQNADPTLADRSIKIAVFTEEEIPERIKETYKTSKYYRYETYNDEDPPYFWDAADWNVTIGDHLVSFEREKAAIKFRGSWRVVGLIKKGGIIAVEKVPDLLGRKLKGDDTKRVANALKLLIENKQIKADGPPLPVMTVSRLMRGE